MCAPHAVCHCAFHTSRATATLMGGRGIVVPPQHRGSGCARISCDILMRINCVNTALCGSAIYRARRGSGSLTGVGGDIPRTRASKRYAGKPAATAFSSPAAAQPAFAVNNRRHQHRGANIAGAKTPSPDSLFAFLLFATVLSSICPYSMPSRSSSSGASEPSFYSPGLLYLLWWRGATFS